MAVRPAAERPPLSEPLFWLPTPVSAELVAAAEDDELEAGITGVVDAGGVVTRVTMSVDGACVTPFESDTLTTEVKSCVVGGTDEAIIVEVVLAGSSVVRGVVERGVVSKGVVVTPTEVAADIVRRPNKHKAQYYYN